MGRIRFDSREGVKIRQCIAAFPRRVAGAVDEVDLPPRRDRRPVNSPVKIARSTRANRSCCRRPVSTTRKAATRSSSSDNRYKASCGPTNVSRLAKAKNADVYLLEQQTYE